MPRSEATALRWTERGCDLGDGDACYLLGRRLAIEGGTEADRARAVRYLTIACDAEAAGACDWLARVKR